MKNIFTILTVLVFTSMTYSQNNIEFGLFGGVNYAHPEGDYIDDLSENLEDQLDYYDDNDNYNLDINRGGVIGRVGIHLGVSAEIAFQNNDNVSLMTSVSYSQKGFYSFMKIEGEYDNGSGNPYDVMLKESVKIKLDYIDIPFLIKYNVNPNVYVFGGPLLSFLITEDNTVEVEYDEEWNGEDDSDSETYDWDEAWSSSDDLEERLMGYQIGIGFINDKYDFSLKINKNSDFGEINGDDDNSNITLQLSTGISF